MTLLLAAVSLGLALEPYQGMQTQDRMRTTALTPAQLTTPIMDLDCSLADRAGAWHRVSLRITGGRGYTMPWGSGPLNTHTPLVGEVRQDPSSLFQGLPHLEDKFQTLVFGRAEGPWVEFRSFAGPPSFSTVALSQRRSRYERDPSEATYVGHCDVRETPQQPLSEAETREWLAR